VSQFSHKAQQNINKIHARMSKLQQQLHTHGENKEVSPVDQPEYKIHTAEKGIDKSKSNSNSSSHYSPGQLFQAKTGKQTSMLSHRNSHKTVLNTKKKPSNANIDRYSGFSDMTNKHPHKH
jgi:hypothetical protein